jgi:hypothetical protein
VSAAGKDSRSGAHLSALALETTDALLSPLSSHLRRWSGEGGEVSDWFSRPKDIFWRGAGDSQFCEDEERWLKKDKSKAIPRGICVVGSLLS